MKVNGPMMSNEKPTDAHIAMRDIQNGKKSRAIRAAALKKTASKKQRRIQARWNTKRG